MIITVRVKVRVDTARLPSLHQLDPLHDLVGETHLGEADLFGDLSYPQFTLWACVGVHEDYCQAVKLMVHVKFN
jgi:hypothetical protein